VLELIVLLLRAIALTCRGHQDIVLENLALRHQLRTLQRSVQRPHLLNRDRVFWVVCLPKTSYLLTQLQLPASDDRLRLP
jgi:hypothetical protein